MADNKDKTGFSLVSFSDNSVKKGGSAVYGLGVIGALFYYIQAADSFGEGLIGILQSFVWPAYIVYKLLEGFYGPA